MKAIKCSQFLVLCLIMVVQVALSGCDILSSSDKPPRTSPPPPEYTDEQLLELVYSGYKFPDDFYEEDLEGASIYYVNTVSVLPLHERKSVWIEFCTDDRDQAFAWSESSNVNSSYYRDLVSESETEKYYEFRRVYAERPTNIVLYRAHKCSYIDRSSVDKFHLNDTLGVFTQRPITVAAVKELAEYIQFINTYNNGSSKTLHSESEEDDTSVSLVIHQLSIGFGDWGMCDQISLGTVTYSVDRQTGVITISRERIRGVQGGKCH